MKDINDLVDSSEFATSKKRLIKRGFKLAKAAREASTWKGPHLGASLIYKNRVLAMGWNSEKETKLQKSFNRYRTFDAEKYKNCEHAEIHALRNLIRNYNLKEIDMKKVNIFIYREWKDGTTALAKPCIACEMALRDIGIRNVFYTGENGIVYEHYDERKKRKE